MISVTAADESKESLKKQKKASEPETSASKKTEKRGLFDIGDYGGHDFGGHSFGGHSLGGHSFGGHYGGEYHHAAPVADYGHHGHHQHHEKTITVVKNVPVPYPVVKHIPVEHIKHVPVPYKVAVPHPYPVSNLRTTHIITDTYLCYILGRKNCTCSSETSCKSTSACASSIPSREEGPISSPCSSRSSSPS